MARASQSTRTSIPRPEYPRPQFVRADWLNLNGEWEFEIDHGDSGFERGILGRSLKDKIIVPFCPESRLSGIEHTDFLTAVWYRKEVQVPSGWNGRRVLLRFQASDYDTTVWVNGEEVTRHRGGMTPFSIDLSHIVQPGGAATIVVRARDDMKQTKPKGKQSALYHNHACDYTRTTGIWQTVWLEPVPQTYLKRARITPDVPGRMFRIEQPICGNSAGMSVRATLHSKNSNIVEAQAPAGFGFAARIDLQIPEGKVKLWSHTEPHLYQLTLELLDTKGAVIDTVESYAGLRSISIDGKAVKLNGQTVFQRLVLDQGYYPDGILTAPSEQALIRDIELSMAAGFNGARLHQKVFEERFLHHCDRLGYLVWGEFPDWGMRGGNDHPFFNQPALSCVTQWLEAPERDYSHPAIIGWCPLNETPEPITDRHTTLDDVTRALFLATKQIDATRPVLDASGYSHRVIETDIYDSHHYEQDPQKLKDIMQPLAEDKPFINTHENKPISLAYRGQPYFVSEFGGTWWNPDATHSDTSWGYGHAPKTLAETQQRVEDLFRVLLENPHMFGYCYTQLTDVFQEQNGIYTFDRRPKLDIASLKKLQQATAAIELPRGKHQI